MDGQCHKNFQLAILNEKLTLAIIGEIPQMKEVALLNVIWSIL